MSDSEHSSVTYTSVPSPVEDYSDIGSPEVDGPLSPNYVSGSEEPEQAPPSPVYLPYVPELVYPEYMPPEDDVFPAEEQPLPIAATPTVDSLGYIPEFDPKGDPKEDDEEDPEEDPADYHADSTVRLRFASPTPNQEVRESSAAGAARQDEPAVARDDPYSLREARMAREAWGLSMNASDNTCSDVISLRTTLMAQHALILDLHAADRRRQWVIKELLVADHKRQKMTPKQTTRSTPVITTPAPETTTTTSVTNAQLQATIDQGVTNALAACDTNRNGDDSHTSRTGRLVQVARECTYPDFLKCQPLNFKGTEGIVGLSQWFEKMESVYYNTPKY
nr:hypothetical protein [Tanacetum cinerariifolium]